MAITLEHTRTQALRLPEKDRARLAHELISSLEEESSEYDGEWDAEICRRVDEIERGVARRRPGIDVIRDIRAHYS